VKRTPWEGSLVTESWICTNTPSRRDDGPMCGRPAEYEIDFGWDDGCVALACAEHAAMARANFTVRQIKSVRGAGE
jgi:hypothetical protein